MAFFDDLKTRQRLAMAAMGQDPYSELGAVSVPGDMPQAEQPPMDAATQISVQNMVDQTAPTTPGAEQIDDSSSSSVGSKMSWEYLSPEDLKRKQELQDRLAELEQRNYEVGQAGIDDYAQSLSQYANAPVGTNWSPLSALVADTTGVGRNVAQYLQANAPESIDEKRKNLIQMKQQLQGMKGSLSKDQLAYLKEQLASYEDMMRFEISENRADKRAAAEEERLNRLYGKDAEKREDTIRKDVNKIADDFQTRQGQIGIAEDAVRSGDTRQISMVMASIARNIGEQKGSLSDGDVARTMPKDIATSVAELQAYLGSVKQISPELQTSLLRLVNAAKTNANKNYKESLERRKKQYGAGRYAPLMKQDNVGDVIFKEAEKNALPTETPAPVNQGGFLSPQDWLKKKREGR